MIKKLNLQIGSLCLLLVTSSCMQSGYNDKESPLRCGALDFEVQAGITPLIWHDLGKIKTVSFQEGSILFVNNVPKFDKLFNLPWTVGGQLGFALSPHIRIFFELNYLKSSAKNPAQTRIDINSQPPESTLDLILNDYRLYDFNFGARYYSNRWSNIVSFFGGIKIGLTHHNRTNFSMNISLPAFQVFVPIVLEQQQIPFLKKSMTVSGGINCGFDFYLGHNFTFLITGEIVVCGGPKINTNVSIDLNDPEMASPGNILFDLIGNEIRFPITAGIRYSF